MRNPRWDSSFHWLEEWPLMPSLLLELFVWEGRMG